MIDSLEELTAKTLKNINPKNPTIDRITTVRKSRNDLYSSKISFSVLYIKTSLFKMNVSPN